MEQKRMRRKKECVPIWSERRWRFLCVFCAFVLRFGRFVLARRGAESRRASCICDSMLYACFCTTSVPACHILPKCCHQGLQNLAQPCTSLRALVRRYVHVVSIWLVIWCASWLHNHTEPLISFIFPVARASAPKAFFCAGGHGTHHIPGMFFVSDACCIVFVVGTQVHGGARITPVLAKRVFVF